VISSQSEKANNIDGHLGACVILCDEPPKWYSDADAEDKNYDKVQETKNVLTQHQHNRSVLKMEEHEGRSFRLQHNICTDDPRAWAFCTNKPRNKRHALGTRIFQVTLPKPRHAPESFDYPVDPDLARDTRNFFQLDQALCVEVSLFRKRARGIRAALGPHETSRFLSIVLANSGQVYTALTLEVIPDPDLWLFRNVSKRVFQILREWKILEGDRGDRSRQIMAAFVRHQIIMRGVTACRHVPGGALYNVPYRAEDGM